MTEITECAYAKDLPGIVGNCGEVAPKKRAAAIFFTAAFAALAAAFLAARRIFPPAVVSDAFAGASSPYEALLRAARLLLPILSEFLAAYVFAFSPLCMIACLAALAARGARLALAAEALLAAPALRDRAAFALLAAAALALAVFCALSATLSPKLRTVGFSYFSGRREALRHTVYFLIFSGAAAALTLVSALIVHFA